MKIVAGTFFLASTSADTCICCGFIPDWVKVYSMNGNEELQHWSIHMMRHGDTVGGIDIDDAGAVGAVAVDAGIKIHRGGHIVTASEYSAAMYNIKDDLDYSKEANIGAAYDEINAWTLHSAYTGHWNNPCDTTYVGVGSRICIDGLWYVVTALTSNGELTNEVTLSETGVASGTIECITNMYDYKAAVAGTVTPAGFYIDEGAEVLNATSEIAWFEAGSYDN